MKILIQPYTYTLSHISRPLCIASELKKRGHEIVFTGARENAGNKIRFIEEADFQVITCYEPPADALFDNIRKGKLRFVSEAIIQKMITSDLDLYKEVKPDMVLTDGRFSAALSTQITGVSHAAVVNVSSTEFRALPYIPFFDWIPPWLLSRNSKAWQWLDRFNLTLEMFIFDNVMAVFKKLSKDYKLPKTITATNCLTGKDLTLLADIPAYFPARKLPPDYHYIGPLTWKPSGASRPEPAWWPLLLARKTEGVPIIYMTMGTTGIPDFFHKMHALANKMEMMTIITTGGQVSNLASVHGKIQVEDFLDGDTVIAACDLVICHGGNGTIYQALLQGKPIIGIPTIPDQEFNMRRVEALGVGRTLPMKQFRDNPDSLREMIDTLLHDQELHNMARKRQMEFSEYGNAGRRAADQIESMFSRKDRNRQL